MLLLVAPPEATLFLSLSSLILGPPFNLMYPVCLSYGFSFFRKLARVPFSHLQANHLLNFCCFQEAVYYSHILVQST